MKRVLAGIEYICGSILTEYFGDESNKDLLIFKAVFVKENVSCSINIELPYYSCDFLKVICIYCGCDGKNLITTPESYPKCQKCKNEKDVLKRKRKTMCLTDLSSKKQKKNWYIFKSELILFYIVYSIVVLFVQ